MTPQDTEKNEEIALMVLSVMTKRLRPLPEATLILSNPYPSGEWMESIYKRMADRMWPPNKVGPRFLGLENKTSDYELEKLKDAVEALDPALSFCQKQLSIGAFAEKYDAHPKFTIYEAAIEHIKTLEMRVRAKHPPTCPCTECT